MSLTLLHEQNSAGQHRIVAVADDGTNKAGEWAPIAELATLLDCYANADPASPLPPGIFTVREKPHQVLV